MVNTYYVSYLLMTDVSNTVLVDEHPSILILRLVLVAHSVRTFCFGRRVCRLSDREN